MEGNRVTESAEFHCDTLITQKLWIIMAWQVAVLSASFPLCLSHSLAAQSGLQHLSNALALVARHEGRVTGMDASVIACLLVKLPWPPDCLSCCLNDFSCQAHTSDNESWLPCGSGTVTFTVTITITVLASALLPTMLPNAVILEKRAHCLLCLPLRFYTTLTTQ